MSIEKKSISEKTIELIWNDARGLANAFLASRASGRRAIKSCSERHRSLSIFLLWECDSLQTLNYHSLLLHLINYPYCLLILFKNQVGVNKSAIALWSYKFLLFLHVSAIFLEGPEA
jgi:hypothetical protein